MSTNAFPLCNRHCCLLLEDLAGQGGSGETCHVELFTTVVCDQGWSEQCHPEQILQHERSGGSILGPMYHSSNWHC